MLKFPKTVTVGGKLLRIIIEPGMENWGEYHADAGEIRLASRCLFKASCLRETLRHEIMHAALDVAGLSYMKNYEEESLVRCMDTIFWPAWERTRKALDP